MVSDSHCGHLSLANLSLLALAAAGLVRFLPPLASRAAARASFWAGAAILGCALLAMLVSALAQIALWAGAFMLCGEFADFDDAFYHSAVNFTTLGYGDIVMSRRVRTAWTIGSSQRQPHAGLINGAALHGPEPGRRCACAPERSMKRAYPEPVGSQVWLRRPTGSKSEHSSYPGSRRPGANFCDPYRGRRKVLFDFSRVPTGRNGLQVGTACHGDQGPLTTSRVWSMSCINWSLLPTLRTLCISNC